MSKTIEADPDEFDCIDRDDDTSDPLGCDEWALDCGDPNCCMPGYHFRSECHTPEMMEAQYEEMERDSAEAGPSP